MAAIKQFILYCNDSDRTERAFLQAWQSAGSDHGASHPSHYAYHRHTVLGASNEGFAPCEFAGIAEFWRTDPDAPSIGWSRPLIEGVSPARSVQFVAEEHIIKEGRGPVKFMSLLRRKPGLDAGAFSKAWRVHHPLVVRSVAEIWRMFRGYRQNHIIPGTCRHLDGSDMARPFDGIVEIWFDSLDDLKATMMSERYRAIVRPDEETFVDLPNTRLLATEEIVLPG